MDGMHAEQLKNEIKAEIYAQGVMIVERLDTIIDLLRKLTDKEKETK